MLTRRHIRVKVMQAIYALHKEENHNLQRGESFLLSSMDNMYSLYISLMGLWGALQERSSQMHALSKSKFIRDENLSHTLFCENKALQLITRLWRARCIVAIALLREVSKQISNYLLTYIWR